MKIMVVGPGGVGGYVAGALARVSDEISLIARGSTLDIIQKNGITVKKNDETYTVHPKFVGDNAAEAGIQDAIIIATKGYDIESVLPTLKGAIGEHTLLLPLLNGISAPEQMDRLLDKGIVLGGLIYIVSMIEEPGVIKMFGDMQRIVMGMRQGEPTASMKEFQEVLTKAGIVAEISDDIERDMWIKWSFMVATGQSTAYFDMCVGELREHPPAAEFFKKLLTEVCTVAKAKGVKLPDDLIDSTLERFNNFPYETTASVARDIKVPGKKTEIGLLSGTLCPMAKELGIAVPNNDLVLEKFKDRV